MSKKVLGFEKDKAIACIFAGSDTGKRYVIMKTEGNTTDKNNLRRIELVPVVSLEWLKQWIKDYIEDEPIEEAWISATELLSATKKQADEKR